MCAKNSGSVHGSGFLEHLLHLLFQQRVLWCFQQRVFCQHGGGLALGGVKGAGVDADQVTVGDIAPHLLEALEDAEPPVGLPLSAVQD